MADPFVAEIRIFPFNFPPKGWAFCDGQLMPISQNTALFSLLGTTYGGDGKSTFALPNLQGSVPLHVGGAQPGPGLSVYDLGQSSGSDTITLLDSEMPVHNHFVQAFSSPGNVNTGDPTLALARSKGGSAYKAPPGTNVQFAFNAISPSGSSFPHNNMMPYLTLNFCIALQGVFPARQ
ncbi:MAG: phage tail protein [Acidobacteria bacterium]|nr:MAG: phage tail protein [Acidobacteriota bacterium]